VFDVRFLPNPNYIPQFKKLTGGIPVWRGIYGPFRDSGVYQCISEAADLFDSALYSEEELLDYRVWVHGGTIVGDDCGEIRKRLERAGIKTKRRIGCEEVQSRTDSTRDGAVLVRSVPSLTLAALALGCPCARPIHRGLYAFKHEFENGWFGSRG